MDSSVLPSRSGWGGRLIPNGIQELTPDFLTHSPFRPGKTKTEKVYVKPLERSVCFLQCRIEG